MPRIAATALLALSILGLAAAQDAKPARVGLPYMLPTCVISGETLGDDAVVVILEGQKRAGDNGREISTSRRSTPRWSSSSWPGTRPSTAR